MSNEKNVRYCESSLNDKRRVKNIKKTALPVTETLSLKIDAQPNMLRFANIELTLSDEAERLWIAV